VLHIGVLKREDRILGGVVLSALCISPPADVTSDKLSSTAACWADNASSGASMRAVVAARFSSVSEAKKAWVTSLVTDDAARRWVTGHLLSVSSEAVGPGSSVL
jgi:hypothetical protein